MGTNENRKDVIRQIVGTPRLLQLTIQHGRILRRLSIRRLRRHPGRIRVLPLIQGMARRTKTIRHYGQVPKEANDLLGQTLNHVHERGPTLR